MDLWEKHKEELRQALEIIDNPLVDKFKWVEKEIKKSKNQENKYIYWEILLNFFLRISRDLLILKLGNDLELIHPFLKDSLAKISRKYSLDKILDFYNRALESKLMWSQNVNSKIVLENLLII